jgi:DNA-binding SARP family transcriptional activator
MEFRILGNLEVRDRGRLIELRRRKPRALLALLLLHSRQFVSADELIDALWGDDSPPTARAALQNYVSQLRAALGPGVIDSGPGGYMLDVLPDQVDLARFEQLVADGRAAQREERVEKLLAALELWRGPPLADLAYEPFAALEIGRIEELRTAAIEDLVEARLALGAGAELVGELEELVAQHPFRERLRGQLMLALYRAGRQADALEAYQEARKFFVDELGIEPGAALRNLERTILRQEPSLAGAAGEQVSEARREPRRRRVTVVFVEVTSRAAVDPEALRTVTKPALALVREALEAHGATVELHAGGEVVGIFGLPRTHEDDVLRAVRAALELRQTARRTRRARTKGVELELRAALEMGEVLAGVDAAGDSFVAGPVVNEARRLLASAPPGELVIGAEAFTRIRESVVASPPDAASASGSHRIVGLRGDAAPVARRLDTPLVGRDSVLEALERSFRAAVESRSCRLSLVVGEAGIGKTRVATEFTARLDRSAQALVGRCVAYGQGATAAPVAAVVRQLGDRADVARLLEGEEDAEIVASRLLELTEPGGGESAGGETFWAVGRALAALARRRPLIVVFEDLHWAAPMLFELVDYLCERIRGSPILILGLARPEALDAWPDWRDAATALPPLSAHACQELIDNLSPVADELRAQIVDTAGGNPLFLEQLLSHATSGGAPTSLPPSLDALLASRLDLLEPTDLAVLQRAAVAGEEFSTALVARMLGDGPAKTEPHLLELVRTGLIEKTPGQPDAFRFHHTLIRDAAYATLPKARRSALHRRFAHWLETAPDRTDELVGFHLEQAHRYLVELDPDDGRAGRLAVAAGDRLSDAGIRAARRGDTFAACDLLARASNLLPTPPVVGRDLLTELGLMQWKGGDVMGAAETLHRARDAAADADDRRAELRARVELANLGLFRHPEGGADELLALSSAAIPVFEQAQDDRALGRVWYVLSYVHGGHHCEYAKSSEAAEHALVYFVRSGWPAASCYQEIAAALYYGPAAAPEGTRRCEELLAAADRGGEANVLAFLAGLEAMGGDLDAGRAAATRAREIYEELAWAVNVVTNWATVAADIELLAGDLEAAAAILTHSCERLGAWGMHAHLATQAAQLGEAHYGRGEYGKALHSAAVAEAAASTDDASAQFSWRALRAKALAHDGQLGEAEALAREAAEIAASTDAVSQRANVLLAYAEVLRLAGQLDAAAERTKDALGLLERKQNVTVARRARSLLVDLVGS